MDQIIYHFIAFGQQLVFLGWNVWIFLFVCFVDPILKRYEVDFVTIVLYPTAAMVLKRIWIIAATGTLGEFRWWPSRDRLSHLIPPSIKNTTVVKCT